MVEMLNRAEGSSEGAWYNYAAQTRFNRVGKRVRAISSRQMETDCLLARHDHCLRIIFMSCHPTSRPFRLFERLNSKKSGFPSLSFVLEHRDCHCQRRKSLLLTPRSLNFPISARNFQISLFPGESFQKEDCHVTSRQPRLPRVV